MRNPQVNRRLAELRDLIDRTVDATQDVNLQAHLGRYLCVMVAGFLEYGLQTVYTDFAERSSSPQAARFASGRIGRITNPNAERFLQTAGAFEPRWREELSEFFLSDSARMRNVINSIMSARNQIVHGGAAQVTVSSVRDYLNCSVEVLEFIENQCMGDA